MTTIELPKSKVPQPTRFKVGDWVGESKILALEGRQSYGKVKTEWYYTCSCFLCGLPLSRGQNGLLTQLGRVQQYGGLSGVKCRDVKACAERAMDGSGSKPPLPDQPQIPDFRVSIRQEAPKTTLSGARVTYYHCHPVIGQPREGYEFGNGVE